MLNIVCTSKPCDGLFYYSYEYSSLLNLTGINCRVIVIPHRNFSESTYIESIKQKYISCENIEFNIIPDSEDITLVMGRSMITLSWQDYETYSELQKESLKKLFSNKIISVYSENHPEGYPKALAFYSPKQIIDLCDKEVYPNGVGEHFEKTINFDIYKPYIENKQFEYLFLGTNERYYAAVEKVIDQFPDHGILTYNASYVNINNNNISVPVENLMGLFETYVYVKETFDPAPRIIQECKYFGKNMIYLRDNSIVDGGSVYWSRPIKNPDPSPIITAVKKLL